MLKPIKDFKLYYITKDHKHQTIISKLKKVYRLLHKKRSFANMNPQRNWLYSCSIMNIFIETEKKKTFLMNSGYM